MVAITLTEYQGVPIPGVKKGKWSAQNDYTSKFGFNTLKGVVLTVDSDDDAIVSATISSGQATIGLVDDDGAAITSTTTGYYWAWGE